MIKYQNNHLRLEYLSERLSSGIAHKRTLDNLRLAKRKYSNWGVIFDFHNYHHRLSFNCVDSNVDEDVALLIREYTGLMLTSVCCCSCSVLDSSGRSIN